MYAAQCEGLSKARANRTGREIVCLNFGAFSSEAANEQRKPAAALIRAGVCIDVQHEAGALVAVIDATQAGDKSRNGP